MYKEKLTLAAGQNFVSLLGKDAAKTILTYDDDAQRQTPQDQNIGTSGSASFFVRATDFSAENITFANSAGPVGQALSSTDCCRATKVGREGREIRPYAGRLAEPDPVADRCRAKDDG